MSRLGLQTEVVDPATVARTAARFRRDGVRLPTFAELARPETIPDAVRASLAGVDPDAPDPRNLFRVHWHNDADRRGVVDVPGHFEVPRAFSGVDARIVVALGRRFPLIGAHKVLAAYACLVPRLVTGQFDPARHRAIWPSTGNYCRGGVAISRILDCRGVAVLPAGMSRERFDWLSSWVRGPDDVIRTVGTESNVKEIYDRCAELEQDPENVVFNQFCEFPNHLAHLAVTGPALERIFRSLSGSPRLAAFVSATGSAGTIAAGNHLKDVFGSKTVAVEALQCPTLLYNGFGAHNIQGIGDKHVPLIHDVMATDVVTAIDDRDTDGLFVLAHREVGRAFLRDALGLTAEEIDALAGLGLSGWCNVLAAVKVARRLRLGPDDVLITVATDGAELYASEADRLEGTRFGGAFTATDAARVFGRALDGRDADHLLELGQRDRERIFNLGYYTWVEQQGVSLDEFEARRDPAWWRALRALPARWDALIDALNRAVAG